MSGSPADPKIELAPLTGLRGIAAWFVVLYHIRYGAASAVPEDVTAVLAKGYLAVDLFFMLSGFVLWLNYSERMRSDGLSAAPAFIGRRLARIWPLHLFVLAAAAAFAAVLEATGNLNPSVYPWAELPLHVLLVQNWGLTSGLSWNVPAWSISCEFAAYLLFPLLALVIDWRRLSPTAAVAAIVLLSILLSWSMAAGGAATLGEDVPRFGLVRALCEFAMGTAVCALWMRWRASPSRPAAGAALTAGAVASAGAAGILPETQAAPLVFAGALLALALTAQSPLNPLGWRPIHYLGRISYATYLVHYLLYILFKLLFVDDPSRVPLPVLGGFLLLTFVTSALLHHFVELPAQRAANRALAGRPRASAALSAT